MAELETGVQIVLVLVTVTLVIITARNMKKTNEHTEQQLKLTRKQLDNTFRAEIQIERANSGVSEKEGKPFGFFQPLLRNIGTVSASNVRLYNHYKFSDITIEELVKERKKIKSKGVIIMPGSILRDKSASFQIIYVPLPEKKPFEIAIWVEYDYLEKKNNELIQVFHVSEGTVFNRKGTFEEHHIEQAEKNLREKGFILSDS